MEKSPVLTQMPTRNDVKVLTFSNITMAKLTLITVLHLIFIQGFIPAVDNQMCSSTTEGAA